MSSVNNTYMDKAMMLDECVDGDETRFGNLIGKDYDNFILIYNVVKNNEDKFITSGIKCSYLQDNSELSVKIPVKEDISDLTQLDLPINERMTAAMVECTLFLNITVKKEW